MRFSTNFSLFVAAGHIGATVAGPFPQHYGQSSSSAATKVSPVSTGSGLAPYPSIVPSGHYDSKTSVHPSGTGASKHSHSVPSSGTRLRFGGNHTHPHDTHPTHVSPASSSLSISLIYGTGDVSHSTLVSSAGSSSSVNAPIGTGPKQPYGTGPTGIQASSSTKVSPAGSSSSSEVPFGTGPKQPIGTGPKSSHSLRLPSVIPSGMPIGPPKLNTTLHFTLPSVSVSKGSPESSGSPKHTVPYGTGPSASPIGPSAPASSSTEVSPVLTSLKFSASSIILPTGIFPSGQSHQSAPTGATGSGGAPYPIPTHGLNLTVSYSLAPSVGSTRLPEISAVGSEYTSTVYGITTITVKTCAPTVTDCPARSKTHTSVLTSAVSTVITGTSTFIVSGSSTLVAPVASSSQPAGISAGASTTEIEVTSTIYMTRVVTVTGCAPGVTDCPAASKTHVSAVPTVITSTVVLTSTVYPTGASPSSTLVAPVVSASSADTSSTIVDAAGTELPSGSLITYTTISTIYSTILQTTHRSGRVVTVTSLSSVTTTICPVTAIAAAGTAYPTGSGFFPSGSSAAPLFTGTATGPQLSISYGLAPHSSSTDVSPVIGEPTPSFPTLSGLPTGGYFPSGSGTAPILSGTASRSHSTSDLHPLSSTELSPVSNSVSREESSTTLSTYFASTTAPSVTRSDDTTTSEDWITSTVTATKVSTITKCAATVTACPARSKTIHVVTTMTTEYVTVCPVSEATPTYVTSDGTVSSGFFPRPTGSIRLSMNYSLAPTISSTIVDAAATSASNATAPYPTGTAVTTVIHTITASGGSIFTLPASLAPYSTLQTSSRLISGIPLPTASPTSGTPLPPSLEDPKTTGWWDKFWQWVADTYAAMQKKKTT